MALSSELEPKMRSARVPVHSISPEALSDPTNTFCASEVAFQVQRYAFDYLDAPVRRVCGTDTSMHYAPNLVEAYLPTVAKVIEAVKAVTYK